MVDAPGLTPSATRPLIPGDGPQTVSAVLDRWVRERPDHLALVGRSGRFSYAQLDAAADRAARALTDLGLRAGDRVAACLPNDVDIVIAFLAAQRLGGVWVGINRQLAGPEKGYMLNDCGARIYLAAADLREEIDFQAAIEGLERVVSVDPSNPGCEWSRLLAAANGPPPRPEIDPFAAAAIAYTSGTTGFPKGAVHSQHNLLLPGAVVRILGNRARTAHHGVVLPLTILNLMVLGPVSVLQDGRTCVCMDRIDALGVAEWVRTEQIHSFDGVPTLIHDLLTHPDVKTEDLNSLTHPGMGGADVSPELVRLYEQRFGRRVAIGYGMTEAPTAVTWTDGSVETTPGLCGLAEPQVTLEIRDTDDRPLPSGEVGQICVLPAREGPFAGVYTPMLGYWNQPEASAEALRGGAYHTGDLGSLAEDGNLSIRGRRNELILRGGANVYPAEVERVLQGHPAVEAAAVFGIQDERLGERVVAAVQLAAGASVDGATLRTHVAEQLARYKVPEAIRVVDEMPRNAMNKIVKARLAEGFASQEARESQESSASVDGHRGQS